MALSFTLILPAVILIGSAFIIYLISRWLGLNNRSESLITVLALIITLILLIKICVDLPRMLSPPYVQFGNIESNGSVLVPSAVGNFIMIISVVIAILITLFSAEYLGRDPRFLLFYPLVLISQGGLQIMFLTTNLFTLFMITELITVASSALIAFRYDQRIAIKAGYKYLIMSSLGTMMMLLGTYFFYRVSGDLHLTHVLEAPNTFTRFAAACFMLGFSLKAGVFPLHTWVPDVYGYAPSSISGLLAGVTSKSMLFILPVICLRLGVTKVELGSYLLVFACFNMVIGSIRMLGQSRLRRFLAYSAITQTGFLMFSLGIGFYFDLDQAVSASLYLFLGIAVMKSLAFLASGVYQFYLRTQDIEELRGEGLRFPQIAISFSIALAGLAGIPLLAGFTGKWLVFSAALRVRHIFSTTSLVVFLICSIIGFGGYLPVLVKQYFRSSDKQNQINEHKRTEKISFWMLTPIVFLSVLVIIIGAYPSPWIQLIDYVIQWMLI